VPVQLENKKAESIIIKMVVVVIFIVDYKLSEY